MAQQACVFPMALGFQRCGVLTNHGRLCPEHWQDLDQLGREDTEHCAWPGCTRLTGDKLLCGTHGLVAEGVYA